MRNLLLRMIVRRSYWPMKTDAFYLITGSRRVSAIVHAQCLSRHFNIKGVSVAIENRLQIPADKTSTVVMLECQEFFTTMSL